MTETGRDIPVHRPERIRPNEDLLGDIFRGQVTVIYAIVATILILGVLTTQRLEPCRYPKAILEKHKSPAVRLQNGHNSSAAMPSGTNSIFPTRHRPTAVIETKQDF